METRGHHVGRTKDSACGNLSERKYSSNVSILTELVTDLNAEKDSVSFVNLCGFSYEIAKRAIFTFPLRVLAKLPYVCVCMFMCFIRLDHVP